MVDAAVGNDRNVEAGGFLGFGSLGGAFFGAFLGLFARLGLLRVVAGCTLANAGEVEEAGDDDVLRKVRGDLEAGGKPAQDGGSVVASGSRAVHEATLALLNA